MATQPPVTVEGQPELVAAYFRFQGVSVHDLYQELALVYGLLHEALPIALKRLEQGGVVPQDQTHFWSAYRELDALHDARLADCLTFENPYTALQDYLFDCEDAYAGRAVR